MLRTLFLVLLLANALLLAATSGLLDTGGDSEREPERLQRQHQPGLVKLLDPQAASAALAAASAARAASAALAAAICTETGPLGTADAAVAERQLRELDLPPGTWQALRRDEGGAWLIYMGRFADRGAMQRKLAELARLKVDGEEVLNAPDLQPGISLGRFEDAEGARAALAQLGRHGVRTARVIALQAPQTLTVLRLPAADGALRARLAALPWPAGLAFAACAANSPAAPASAAAAPAASSATAAPAASAKPAAPAVAPAAVPASRPAAAVPAASAVAPAAARPAASGAAPAARPAAAASAPQARVASADTRAALQRAASAAAAEAAARAAPPGSAPASR